MHLSHKYWARKPHNVVASYIEAYSKPGEIVLDPFVGSGTTVLESLRLGRKAIGIDINPTSQRLITSLLHPCSISRIENEMKDFLQDIKEKLTWLYNTKCKCGNTAEIRCSIWNRDDKYPHEIRYDCPACGPKQRKKIDEFDKEIVSTVLEQEPSSSLINKKMEYPSGELFLKRERQKTYQDLFTYRNLFGLMTIWENIKEKVPLDLQLVFKHSFTSMVHLASKLTPVRPTRPFSSFWPVHSYWVPPLYMESNVISLLESAMLGKQGVLKAKTEVKNNIGEPILSTDFNDLVTDGDYFILTKSSEDLSEIPTDSIDFVFTDPPYGGDIQYYELSWLWNVWFEDDPPTWHEREIIVNPRQNKTLQDFKSSIDCVFREIARITKPEGRIVVTFFQRKHPVTESVVSSARNASLLLEHVLFQPSVRQSSNSLLNPQNSAVGDYVLRFRVHTGEKDQTSSLNSKIKTINDVIIEILSRRGEPSTLSDILRGQHLLFSLNEECPSVTERFSQALQNGNFEQLAEQRWWVKDDIMFSGREIAPPLSNRIETYLVRLLSDGPASMQDITNSLFQEFPDIETPSMTYIKGLLTSHAVRRKNMFYLKESH